jgi:hypothetical protein
VSESYRRQRIREALTKRGYLVLGQPAGPWAGGGRSDLIVCALGVFVAIEIKEPGKRPTPKQDAFMKAVRDARGHAFWCTTVEEAIEGVERAVQI